MLSAPFFRLVTYPNEVLTSVCRPLPFTPPPDISEVICKMRYLLIKHGGLGISAPQVGIGVRLFILSNAALGVKFEEYINPTLFFPESGQVVDSREGCLSVPGAEVVVPRFSEVVIKFKDRYWIDREEHFRGIHSFVVQHECDHLEGKGIWSLLPSSTGGQET